MHPNQFLVVTRGICKTKPGGKRYRFAGAHSSEHGLPIQLRACCQLAGKLADFWHLVTRESRRLGWPPIPALRVAKKT